MKRQPSSHFCDAAPPPKSRTRLPSNAPILPSRTEVKSEVEDKMQCTPSPGKRAPSHDSNPNWAQDHRPERARIPANYQRLPRIESLARSHTLHPSELPFPRNDLEYSTVWVTGGPDANVPPLPMTTTRNEEFDRWRDPYGRSILSTVASTEDQGHGDQQVKVKIESNSPGYGPTTSLGLREPEGYNDPELQRHRNARDPFKTPYNPILFYSPFQRSARRSEEHGRPRQLSNGLYQSIEGNDFDDQEDTPTSGSHRKPMECYV
ncbi:hypothetical protein EYC80_008420 [Monilinia laxa]|uniref:Uncharacterized protein n=1 Tax=Monilinia laxa TaxID=61186 RepID=A0A5N6JQ68_MONLA|nr:hypothetical protein EYC80_008420 [Monilinia laxa]